MAGLIVILWKSCGASESARGRKRATESAIAMLTVCNQATTALMAQAQTVKEGAAAVPYHADGELCRMYPAEEFTALAQAATAHVFYHRTYCNHMNAWIARADLEELPAIVYGAELPKDLAASMAAIIAAAGGGAA